MFDKNVFKENFRLWSNQFPLANQEEIEEFCNYHIPMELRIEYSWLIEQSMSWFFWKQENLQREMLKESNEMSFQLPN